MTEVDYSTVQTEIAGHLVAGNMGRFVSEFRKGVGSGKSR